MIELTHKKITTFLIVTAIFLLLWLSAAYYLVAARSGDIYNLLPSKSLSFKIKTTTEFRLNKLGEQIEIRTAQSQKPSSEIFLYLHGNAGQLPRVIEDLSQFGTVISPSYPGFGGSSGVPTPQGLYDTVDVVMSYLAEKGIDQSQVIVVGHSMGASTALYAGMKYPQLKKIILVSAYYSIQAMCEKDFSILCILTGNVLNNSKLAPKIMTKIRQFHDPKDATVPYNQGRELFGLIGSTDKKFTDLQFSANNDFHSSFSVAEILAD